MTTRRGAPRGRSTDEQIEAEVATWPPLTDEQRDALAGLLRPMALDLRRQREQARQARPGSAA